MANRLMIVPAGIVAVVLGASIPASAGSVTFDFNSLANGAPASGGAGPTASIENYMRSLLTGGASVTVSSGAIADKTYNGDGHVTGPGTTAVTSVTLATSDGDGNVAANQHLSSTDTFIRNSSSASGWTFTFTGGFVMDSVQFDYEIFPDASCTQLASAQCGGAAVGGIYPNQPDFTFSTNLGQVFHYYGKTPGTGAGSSPYNESPCTDTSTGTGCAAPIAGETVERTPQLLGTTALLNVGGATSLTFMDWPATIGIDNLKINFRDAPPPAAVPEPGSMLLLGTGLATLAARRRKKAAAASL